MFGADINFIGYYVTHENMSQSQHENKFRRNLFLNNIELCIIEMSNALGFGASLK